MPANWHWLALAVAALVAGVVWGLIGAEQEPPLGPEAALGATREQEPEA